MCVRVLVLATWSVLIGIIMLQHSESVTAVA